MRYVPLQLFKKGLVYFRNDHLHLPTKPRHVPKALTLLSHYKQHFLAARTAKLLDVKHTHRVTMSQYILP